MEVLNENEILERVYFMATDGAPVMRSLENGLAGKMVAKVPHLKTLHCVAHRAALGVKDLVAEYNSIKLINTLMYHLVSFFKTHKRLNLLKIKESELFSLDEDECLNLIAPIDVRWCSYLPCIERVLLVIIPII